MIDEAIKGIQSHMLVQAKRCQNEAEALQLLKQVIVDGSALNKLKEMVYYQHGNIDVIDNPNLFKQAKIILPVKAKKEGFVKELGPISIMV